jgi:hypothetical protein
MNPFLLKRAKVKDNQKYYDYFIDLFKTDPVTKTSILSTKNLFKSVPFLLVLFPSKYQISNKYFPELRKIGFTFGEDKVIDGGLQKAIISWAKTEKVNCLDLLPYILKNSGHLGFYYNIDDHFTPEGNRFVAEIVSEKLKKDKIIPCLLSITRN